VTNLKVVPETLEPSLQLAAAVLAQVSSYLIISSTVLISNVWNLMHRLHFRQNFQCQRFRKPSASSGIDICQSLQRCVIMSSFSGLLNLLMIFATESF
jgi:hypothetical protein